MKQVGKSVVIIIAILCVLVFAVGFLGVNTQYGDVTTDIINGVHLVPRGFGFEKEVSLFLTAEREEGDTEPLDYDKIQRIYEKRLELSAAVEYEVFADPANEGIFIKLPYDSNVEENFIPLAGALVTDGLFELREGKDVDDNGIPTGATETVILNNEHIKEVNPMVYSSNQGAIYYLEISLTRAGQKLMQQRADELAAAMPAGEEAYLSSWIDGVMVDYYTASKMSDIETLTAFSASSSGYTLEEVTKLSMAMTSGYLGHSFTLQKVMLDPDSGFAGDNNYKLMVFAFAAAMLIAGVILIVRYRLFGATSFMAILGCIGLMFFVLTSFAGNAATRPVTMASFAAFLVMLFVSFGVVIREAESIRGSSGNTIGKILNEGFRKNTATSLLVYSFLFVVGLLMSDIFHRNGGWSTVVIRWIMPTFDVENYFSLGTFGTLLWTGAVFGAITVVLANRLMAKSLVGFKSIKKSSFLGGKADA